jgi:hypothetical protein
MLNGEPIAAGDPTSSSTPPVSPPGTPIKNPVGAIVGIMGLVFAFAFPPVGLIMGFVSRSMARSAGDRHPFATAAIIVGAILTVLAVIVTVATIWFTVSMATAGFQFCEDGTGDGTFIGFPITCE